MLVRKRINFKPFEELKNNIERNELNVQNCSICSLTLCIGEEENIQFVIYPHLFNLFEPKFFPFTNEGYNQAIDYYQEEINNYFLKLEKEYYTEFKSVNDASWWYTYD